MRQNSKNDTGVKCRGQVERRKGGWERENLGNSDGCSKKYDQQKSHKSYIGQKTVGEQNCFGKSPQ